MGSIRDWLPKIYPILDSSFIPDEGRLVFLDRLGRSLADAGVLLLEYRNKNGTDAEVFADAQMLRAAMPEVRLIMDDRVDVALASNFDGVHVDAGDLSPGQARRLMELSGPERIVGTSAGGEAGLLQTLAEPVDYVAFGPVFSTTTKQTSTAPIGVDGVKRFRQTAGPEPVLVAAAGITLETAPAVLAAGADAVAVAAALFRNVDPAAEFRRWRTVLG
jgi:thiamine-phosphate pyrophosphorylase